ncbi:MAG: EsaB/YukD family protein [Synergistaceae bacterium]|nr:EsaB/YukD family protein [Synergistaceae bacterium]
MNYILVTLQWNGGLEDLKVPAFVPVVELLEMFDDIYGIGGKTLQAEPKGIILDKNKTLEEQGVQNGAKLSIS